MFSRTADITSPERLTAADLYCHRKCLREYFKNHKEESTSKTEDTPEPPNRKKELFHLALKELDKRINDGMGFTMTEIREYMSSLDKDPDPVILYNRDIKRFLEDHYGGKIQFALNPQQNKSELVFLSSISSVDVALKISNINLLKAAGESLRRSMKPRRFILRFSKFEKIMGGYS